MAETKHPGKRNFKKTPPFHPLFPVSGHELPRKGETNIFRAQLHYWPAQGWGARDGEAGGGGSQQSGSDGTLPLLKERK